ncbi:MAG: archaellin/type IV pilin N-terminal domain-containing protein [Thermofilaceae archaeon]
MSLRRGIEPIIATVILVAVALIIAVAVVGYLMGLFGGLTGGQPQISITSIMAKKGTNGLEIQMYLNNAGAGSDKLVKVEIIHGGTSTSYGLTGTTLTLTGTQAATVTATPGGTSVVIAGNYKGWLTINTDYGNASPGDTVILKLYFERSGIQTINVVVSPS